MLKAIATTWLLLVLGDFFSTFCYHIPEHVFGSLHLKTHHVSKQNFRHYAVLMPNFWVLLDGILGALPYLIAAALLWSYSPVGVTISILLGQFHVWWRHTSILGWQTPRAIARLCQIVCVTTPERHWLHHQRTTIAYGDIFTFFEEPARQWLRWLRRLKVYFRGDRKAVKPWQVSVATKKLLSSSKNSAVPSCGSV